MAIQNVQFELDVGGSSASGTLSATVDIPADGSICSLSITGTAPDFTISGSLAANSPTPNVSALAGYFLFPVDLPEIDLTGLNFSFTPASGSYSISADLSSDWSLAFGSQNLAITGASLSLASGKSGRTGSVTGTLLLDQTNKLTVNYYLPGNFSINAQIPSISLSTVIGDLGQSLTAPSGFDFTLTDSTILLQKSGGSYVSLLGTELSTYGSAAFTVQDNNGTWGFVFGLGVDVSDLSTLPGLSFLSTLSSGFGLEEIVLVLSSVSDTSFTFPQLSVFNNPSITATSLSSPAWTGGLVEGLNFYAMLDPSQSSILKPLVDLVQFTDTFAATLQVPTEPRQRDRSVGHAERFDKLQLPAGECRAAGQITGTEVTIGAKASIPTTIDGQSVTFTVEVDVDENGAFISGSTTDTITFADVVQLGGLAVEIGMDLEGIPSFGVAAEISSAALDVSSSIAIFFDSHRSGAEHVRRFDQRRVPADGDARHHRSPHRRPAAGGAGFPGPDLYSGHEPVHHSQHSGGRPQRAERGPGHHRLCRPGRHPRIPTRRISRS